MKALALLILMLPAFALAAPQGPAGQGDQSGAHMERMHKRMRLALMLGLAEALDLDDTAVLRARDVLSRYDAKVMPLRKQLRDGFRILRDAAGGDSAAASQVDATLKNLRDTREKLQNATMDMFQELTQGLSPEKKARAAVFLVHFQEHAARMMKRGFGDQQGFGPHRGMRPGEMMGPHGMGPRDRAEEQAAADGGEGNVPGDWFADE
ncbi:MAG TPA: hypothetical protein VLV17_08195 [Anaeromyxobacteraceae bacterium]|nr:hypothetical protein [Anaeromyxobacteraceae bacterium]